MLGALAAQAGQALQRALLYERQRRTAEVLQRGLLPQRLPAVPGITMAARYAPGAAGLRVGGDWYDAIPVSGGRLALVMGDVMGKGVDAATRMSQIRGAVRVLAAVDPEPVAVAAGLDLLAGELAEDQIVTLVYLLLDPATGEGLIARLGHLPPLVVPRAAASPGCSTARGRRRSASRARSASRPRSLVEPGSVLVLFTDGLVEERRTGLDVGLPALAAESRRLADQGLDVEGFADAVLTLGAADGGRPGRRLRARRPPGDPSSATRRGGHPGRRRRDARRRADQRRRRPPVRAALAHRCPLRPGAARGRRPAGERAA